jgi:hypothetical protein
MAGTVTVTSHAQGRRRVRRIVLACTADAADGSFPATVIPAFEGRIVEVQVNPGPPATVITLATSAASDDIIDTAAPHSYTAGTPVRFKTLTGGTGLVVNTTYYVSATSLAAQTFRVSAAASPDTPLGFTTDITAGTVTSSMFDAPTDNYDITLLDANGFDRLQGLGANRDITNSEVAPIVFSGTSINPIVELGDVLTLTIANNTVVRATADVVIMYAPL